MFSRIEPGLSWQSEHWVEMSLSLCRLRHPVFITIYILGVQALTTFSSCPSPYYPPRCQCLPPACRTSSGSFLHPQHYRPESEQLLKPIRRARLSYQVLLSQRLDKSTQTRSHPRRPMLQVNSITRARTRILHKFKQNNTTPSKTPNTARPYPCPTPQITT